MDNIKIIVADKRELFREGVASLLARQPNFTVLATCDTGMCCINKAAELKPDIILMDTEIEDEDCFNTVSRIQDLLPGVRIFILTHSEVERDLFSALEAGIHGYVSKDISIKRLIENIENIAAGEIIISTPLAAKFLKEASFYWKNKDNGILTNLPLLTQRENEVLALMATGATNRQIAITLSISESTAKVHVSNILDKLRVQNRQQAASIALNQRERAHGKSTKPPAPVH